MDPEKKAEVVQLFQEMAKGIGSRPKPARKASEFTRRNSPASATIIVGSTVVVVQGPEKTALVSKLINLIARK